jgi:hypothetical protein
MGQEVSKEQCRCCNLHDDEMVTALNPCMGDRVIPDMSAIASSPSDATEVQNVGEQKPITTEQAASNISLIPHLGLEDFILLLKHYQMPVEEYGKGKAKHVRDLWVEVQTGQSRLDAEMSNGSPCLMRSVRVVVLEIRAQVEEQDSFLLLKHMFTDSGAERLDLDSRVTRKMDPGEERYASMLRCLTDNLSISEKSCDECFIVESCKKADEVKVSEGYPGMRTRYKLDIYGLHMIKTCLPTTEFETTVPGKMGSGSKRVWRWAQRDQFDSLFPRK